MTKINITDQRFTFIENIADCFVSLVNTVNAVLRVSSRKTVRKSTNEGYQHLTVIVKI